MGIWLFATLAQRCKHLRERLFYGVWILYFLVVGARVALHLSDAVIRASDFVEVILAVTAIALSGTIVL